MSLTIERITDEHGARAFYDLDAATTAADHPGLVPEPLEGIIGMLPNPMPSFHVAFYLGKLSDDVVASAFIGLPQVDNTHTSFLQVTVALEARRRGLGMQMVDFLFAEARAAGRTQANWNTGSPLDGSSPGDVLSERLGAKAALESIRRELRLSELDRGELERRLKTISEGPAANYELHSWRGRCPDELVDGAAKMVPLVMSDSPRGELEMEVEEWDAERYREFESMLAVRQRDSLTTAAVDRTSGELVALTDLNVPLLEHRVVSQLGTAVVAEHRGRRLGLAVKIANVLALVDAYPDAETVQTVNAAENEHMVAVNTQLGFRAVERSRTWQLEL